MTTLRGSASHRLATRRKPSRLTMADVMTGQPHTIGRDQTLATAHRMMRENGIRHLPVLEHGDIVGIVTQRDLYFIETIVGVDIDEDVVSDAMTQDSYVVEPDVSVAEVAR